MSGFNQFSDPPTERELDAAEVLIRGYRARIIQVMLETAGDRLDQYMREGSDVAALDEAANHLVRARAALEKVIPEGLKE